MHIPILLVISWEVSIFRLNRPFSHQTGQLSDQIGHFQASMTLLNSNWTSSTPKRASFTIKQNKIIKNKKLF